MTNPALKEQHQRWKEARARLTGTRPVAVVSVMLPKPEPAKTRKDGRPRPMLVYAYRIGPVAPWRKPPAIVYDEEIGPTIPTPIRAKRILAAVCERHGFTIDEVKGDRRFTKLVLARQEAFWRLKTETRWSLPQIGRFMGGKDHTTVLFGYRRHEERMREAEGGQ
jgi:hypothetical protein